MSPVWSWKGQRPASGWRAIFHGRIPWGGLDWPVFLLALAMVFAGLVFIEEMTRSEELYGREKVDLGSHVKKLVVALPCLVFGLFVRPRFLRQNTWLLYGGAVLLLMLVPFIGEERNNARRWIPMPLGFDIQPSELAKIALILALARALYRNRLREPLDWAVPAALALLPMALVAVQPDLGTALTIVPVTLGLFWVAGASGRVLSSLVGICVLVASMAWQFEWVQGYQKKRIDTWVGSFDDEALIDNKNGPGFHTYHARVVIGNGGVFGTGLGKGVANAAAHLPERDCDSIFCVIAEEGGFVGAAFLVFFYLLFAALMLAAAARTRERYSRLVVAGVGLYFASHFLINVGVNLGLLPMTGLTLPLISTGGSSLMASLLALGLAMGLSARQEPTLDLDAFRA